MSYTSRLERVREAEKKKKKKKTAAPKLQAGKEGGDRGSKEGVRTREEKKNEAEEWLYMRSSAAALLRGRKGKRKDGKKKKKTDTGREKAKSADVYNDNNNELYSVTLPEYALQSKEGVRQKVKKRKTEQPPPPHFFFFVDT